MQGKEYEGIYRVRVGQYRIIYRYDIQKNVSILLIIKIGPRGDIYK